MSVSADDNGSVTPTIREVPPREPRGDINRVRYEVETSLADIVTEAAIQGYNYVCDFEDAHYQASRRSEPYPENCDEQHTRLLRAQECLDISMQYLNTLRSTANHRMYIEGTGEALPF
jgi:hypothetical protein